MAKMVNTVTGPVSTSDLGAVLCHEHVLFGYPGYEGDATRDIWSEERFFEAVGPEIEAIKKQGIKTIVDATPNDLGRKVEMLKRTSEHFGINIICSTGYYYEHGGAPKYWGFRRAIGYSPEEEIYDLFKTEHTEGVTGTGIKCAAVKVGTSEGEMTDYERMMFDAAIRVAKEYPDARIITHCTAGTMLRAQADYFLEKGTNPGQVQLGHACDTRSLEDLLYVMDKGFYAGFDRLGQVNFDGMPDDAFRLSAICALVSSGFGDRVMLSNDKIGWFFGREATFQPELAAALFENWHWTYIFEKVLPTLQSMGLSEEQAHKLMFQNPQRFYAGE